MLDFLLPTGCLVCRNWIPRRDDARIICLRCRTRLRALSWPRCPRCHYPRGTGRVEASDCLECRHWPLELAAARCAFELVAPADDLVHAIKYEGWREVAGFMSEAMAKALEDPLPISAVVDKKRTVIVPIPTTAQRAAARGYNQAGLLAEGIAQLMNLPVCAPLIRVSLGVERSQTTLSPTERRENVQGAFEVDDAGARPVMGADVILVDDVLTTGATAGEASRMLSEAGASTVTLVAFARAVPRRPRRAA